MSVWLQLLTVIRALPGAFADQTDRLLQDIHQPIDPTVYPDGYDCRSCRAGWPCPEFEAAGLRLHRRRRSR